MLKQHYVDFHKIDDNNKFFKRNITTSKSNNFLDIMRLLLMIKIEKYITF